MLLESEGRVILSNTVSSHYIGNFNQVQDFCPLNLPLKTNIIEMKDISVVGSVDVVLQLKSTRNRAVDIPMENVNVAPCKGKSIVISVVKMCKDFNSSFKLGNEFVTMKVVGQEIKLYMEQGMVLASLYSDKIRK